jgi:hypothetical protein
MGELHLISEARLRKPQTIVIAECDGIVEAMLSHNPFRCTCNEKYASMIWLSAHIAREGHGHRRAIVESDD